MVDQVEGADAAALTQKVTKHFGSSAASVTGPIAPLPNARIASNGTASTSGAANGVGTKQQSQQALQTRLDKLVHSAPVLLFMKGTPTEPRCGFSSKVVHALQQAGVDFQHFDILSDDAVRQGLKVTLSRTHQSYLLHCNSATQCTQSRTGLSSHYCAMCKQPAFC